MFAFYASERHSNHIVSKAIQSLDKDEEKITKIFKTFYTLIQCISSQRGKKYVNKNTIVNFCEGEKIIKEIPNIVKIFETVDYVTIEELCEVFRKCCIHYLKN